MSIITDPPPDPNRFEVSKSTLLADTFMNQFIRIGGVGIIVAIFCIFLFILVQILPLFQSADISEDVTITTQAESFDFAGIDEWSELPFLGNLDGEFHFYRVNRDFKARGAVNTSHLSEPFILDAGFNPEESYSTVVYDPASSKAIFGGKEGKCRLVSLLYEPTFDEDGNRKINVDLETEAPFSLGLEDAPVLQIDFYDVPGERIVAAIQMGPDGRELHLVRYKAKKTLFGTGALKLENSYNLTNDLQSEPQKVLINGLGTAVLVTDTAGRLYFFTKSGGEITLTQTLEPFGEGEGSVSSVDWLLGRVTAVLVSTEGTTRIFSMSMDEKLGMLQYHPIQDIRQLEGPIDFFAASQRNRAFLHGRGRDVYLEYATTGKTRWEAKLEFEPVEAVIGPKYDRLMFVSSSCDIHLYNLDDPHPESGLKAFFGKIWYEGKSEPEYLWQSTGSGSSFEPKLSMVPLLLGSFKGTFYALIFAVPIAVLAAAYTSQFLQPSVAKIVKPAMEIMASLPSVVLGFLAALWLAPILETRVPSVLMAAIVVPAVALLAGWGWSQLPIEKRMLIRPGQEFFGLLPLLLIAAWIGWSLGPWVEQILFRIKDPVTGQMISDFRVWWPEVTGLPFEQRNSVVVGFAMGFAVIPIIFTISEDALSNVPNYLRSASYALGASRWQTAWRVVLPTASAGIFSAVMIGLGRAVGETMIVVMATGNTPIMDLNPFSGMRTLAANIAVELPEAPHHSTLYRALFLGAMLLFILTFAINTVAEITRQKLREKFKTVS